MWFHIMFFPDCGFWTKAENTHSGLYGKTVPRRPVTTCLFPSGLVCYVITGLAQAVLGSRASLFTSLVLLAVAIVIELVVLSIIRARTIKKTKA